MTSTLVYSKPQLHSLRAARKSLACVAGSAAGATGWTCANGPRPNSGPNSGCFNGNGAVYEDHGVCATVGSNAVGLGMVCRAGPAAVTTTAGNACIAGGGGA